MSTIAEKADLTILDLDELRAFCIDNAVEINDCWESQSTEYIFSDDSVIKITDCDEVLTYNKSNFF